MISPRALVDYAVHAASLADANAVQDMIMGRLGGRFQRPLGDRWNNHGLIQGAGGSYDTKLIENITNMQDAVLEDAVLRHFQNRESVPFNTPSEAAEMLCSDSESYRELGDLCTVVLRESDPPAGETKRLTAVFRDYGCGITAPSIPDTIFALGSAHKEDVLWLQGAFGLGGETTYRNAHAVVLVSRRQPDLLLPGEEDRVAVAVLLWEKHRKGLSAYYLVEREWEGPGAKASPCSVAADECDFEPGTHLSLISYGVEGLHRGREGGDEKSLQAIVDTRLYRPILPTRYNNELLSGRAGKNVYLRGLKRRLEANPSKNRSEGRETMPFSVNGKAYQLPVEFHVFPAHGMPGGRRSFTAKDHAVIFTSNGQVHYHWTPGEFRLRTRHSKLYNRILVEIDTDNLPIDVRTSLFTADRSELVRNDPAVRLEESLRSFLDEWDELRDLNAKFVREALSATSSSKSTFRIAGKISKALTAKGFSFGTSGASSGQNTISQRGKRQKVKLLKDPDRLEGPKRVLATPGETKFLNFVLNTTDSFFEHRGQLSFDVEPEGSIRTDGITTGDLKNGRFRVSVAIPDILDPDEYSLDVVLEDWLKASGGIGPRLSWKTTIEVVDEKPSRSGVGNANGHTGASSGSHVALIWDSHTSESGQNDGWTAKTVGRVQFLAAEILAEQKPDYAALASLGDLAVPTILLNKDYHLLKKYIQARISNVSETALDQKRERYAVGVGVGLLMLFGDEEKQKQFPEDQVDPVGEALGRSVITMLPEFDKLAQEAGIEEEGE